MLIHGSWDRLKCDRAQPCETCTKRGLSLSCTYVHISNTSERFDKEEQKPGSHLQMQKRIAELERLVGVPLIQKSSSFTTISGLWDLWGETWSLSSVHVCSF